MKPFSMLIKIKYCLFCDEESVKVPGDESEICY